MSISPYWNSLFKLTNNNVYCSGKLIVGKKYYNMIFSMSLITVPSIAFIVLCFISLSHIASAILVSLGVTITFFTNYFLIKSGTMDPGILEKDRYIRDRETIRKKNKFTLQVKGHLLGVHKCVSCYILRPPRTSHCSECDNCVERFDHHCVWIGTCVGKRNHKFFYYFLFGIMTSAFLQTIVNFIIIGFEFNSNLRNNGQGSVGPVVGVAAAIIFFEICFVIFFLGKLFWQQSTLLAKNETFYEDYKGKFKRYPVNPFDRQSIFSNFGSILCKRVPKSSLFLFNQENKTKDDEINVEFDNLNLNLPKENNKVTGRSNSNNSVLIFENKVEQQVQLEKH